MRRTYFIGVFNFGGDLIADEFHGLYGREVEEGRFSVDHLDDHDAEGPDVDGRTIRLARNELGRHPVRGAYQTAPPIDIF